MITALARVARHVAPPVLDALIEWRAPKQREADVEIAKLRRYAPNADAVGPRARGVTHALACVQAPASADTPARQRRRAGGRRLISMDQTFGKITVKEAVAIMTERRAVGARSPQPAVRVPRSASSSPTRASSASAACKCPPSDAAYERKRPSFSVARAPSSSDSLHALVG